MHPDLDALSRRHAISPELLAELEGLLAHAPRSAPQAAETYGSIALGESQSRTITAEDTGANVPTTGRASVRLPSGHATARSAWHGGAWPLALDLAAADPGERYEDLGPLGAGGMGEVRRVRDRTLHRTLAMKLVHAPLVGNPFILSRFLEEARTTAQLQHPAIVPVHDLGQHPDGRIWFTMKEIRGQTLGAALQELHAASVSRWRRSATGWTLRRLTGAFLTVCRAVAYAHARGVVHRDLKPDNIMLGDHGEVHVLDWGLAKLLGQTYLLPELGDLGTVQSGRSIEHATRLGQVAGTPTYMPPEQARGELERIDARSDVYSLGATLYEILRGRPPYAREGREALRQVLAGPPEPLVPEAADADVASPPEGPPLPAPLVRACARAMARAPEDRFPSAQALADEVEAWLDGSRRRQEALAIVARAGEKAPEGRSLRARGAALRAEAEAALADIEPWRPEEAKADAWARQDAAEALDRRAALLDLEEEQLLHGSLTHAPDLPEAHAALANRYRAEHRAIEATRGDSARAEALLRQHLEALPAAHPDRTGLARYLRGDGALTLLTDPPGAEVQVYRYVPHNRRLVLRLERTLGPTPIHAEPLPMGSYLCVLRHPDRAEVRYPVLIEREQHWDCVPPEGGASVPIHLPRRSELGTDDCYVPAGWCWLGGDPQARGSMTRRRSWVDGHVIRRFPVTNREYIAFLESLVRAGRGEEALRHAPRERGGTAGEQGALIYGFDGERFSLRPDADGDVWEPEWPVFMVDWEGATAYAAWEAARSGHPWRLPGEVAWEKAARGVDGRWYPWGDAFDPSWACLRDSHEGRRAPAPVTAFPIDESPYGVRGLAGNACDWCADAYLPDGPAPAGGRAPTPSAVEAAGSGMYRIIRGGAWYNDAPSGRAAARSNDHPGVRNSRQSFRIARSSE